MELFIADTFFSLMLLDLEKEVGFKNTKLLRENIVDFVTKSTVIIKRETQYFQHTMNLRKVVQKTFSLLYLDRSTFQCLE